MSYNIQGYAVKLCPHPIWKEDNCQFISILTLKIHPSIVGVGKFFIHIETAMSMLNEEVTI